MKQRAGHLAAPCSLQPLCERRALSGGRARLGYRREQAGKDHQEKQEGRGWHDVAEGGKGSINVASWE